MTNDCQSKTIQVSMLNKALLIWSSYVYCSESYAASGPSTVHTRRNSLPNECYVRILETLMYAFDRLESQIYNDSKISKLLQQFTKLWHFHPLLKG